MLLFFAYFLCLLISDTNQDLIFDRFSYDLIKPITLLTRIPNYLFEVSTVFFTSRQSLEEKIELLERENFKLEAINNSLDKLSIDLNKINSLRSSINLDLDDELFLISKKISYPPMNINPYWY